MISEHTTTSRRPSRAARRPRTKQFFGALAVFIIVILVAAPQAGQGPAYSGTGGAVNAAASTSGTIDLLVGRSTILNVGSPIARVSLTTPDVADALVTSPTQLVIHGKQPGTISLFVWERGGAIRTFEVTVRRDLSVLTNQLRQLFPGEPITVTGSGKDVVLSGKVSTPYVIEKAAEVAVAYAENKDNVVNLLKMQEGLATNQVMLRVRFAEVSRSALQELGASFFAHNFRNEWFGRTTTQQFPAPEWDEQGRLVFADFLNLFVFNAAEGLGGVVRALSNRGLFQSLAEPNLIALDGQEASFLAGGEFPFPVATPSGAGGYTITVMFKEFGVRLNFTPTILGDDMVRLKVRPEVSSLDFANAVMAQGFRIPALSTRRTETHVELQNGQTFAIAGLMNNTLTNSMSKVPGLGDIPILGTLFKSRAHQKNQTELVVMITPYIVRRGSTGVSEGLPSLVEPYLDAPARTLPTPAPYVGSPRYPATQPAPRGGSDDAAAAVQAPGPIPAPGVSRPEPTIERAAPVAPPLTSPVQAKPVPAPPVTNGLSEPQGARTAAPDVTPAQLRAVEKATRDAEKTREAEEKRRAAEQEAEGRRIAREEMDRAKRQAEEDKAEQKRAEQERKRNEKVEREQARRQAEIDRRNAEVERKKNEEAQKRERALTEAQARLKAAQEAYQAELDKARSGATDKKGSNP